jgi:hypothetical protein
LRIAIGLKTHSGWAALVAVGRGEHGYELIDRRRIELVEPGSAWAKQPYHAAEGLPPDEAERTVQRCLESVRRAALVEVQALAKRAEESGHRIVGVAALTGSPMPDWSTAQILSVHMRMHKAEGALFPKIALEAVRSVGLPAVEVAEKTLSTDAGGAAVEALDRLGRAAGPPWGKDQKSAALAAMLVLDREIC